MAVKDRNLSELIDAEVSKLPYFQAVVKEALRVHPPGPMLSWARWCSSEVQLSNKMDIPADTTAMVNMWAITHDPYAWEDPLEFKPESFIEADVEVRGSDLGCTDTTALLTEGVMAELSNGMDISADTTAMVTMWAITHNPYAWEDPLEFKPESFIEADVEGRGGDLNVRC
ncbi:PREDICTED: cytochrome P450 78A7-like [Populus euphratica]|uniref:Cytochrome P450 78A7-like n=1 Tax=Populus euphratica TaxID=75702 RepID=A0AAJ6XNN7_POPEU|nr:PREDICTED: cytochrome P450 78A7-like [Populus euphratica]